MMTLKFTYRCSMLALITGILAGCVPMPMPLEGPSCANGGYQPGSVGYQQCNAQYVAPQKQPVQQVVPSPNKAPQAVVVPPKASGYEESGGRYRDEHGYGGGRHEMWHRRASGYPYDNEQREGVEPSPYNRVAAPIPTIQPVNDPNKNGIGGVESLKDEDKVHGSNLKNTNSETPSTPKSDIPINTNNSSASSERADPSTVIGNRPPEAPPSPNAPIVDTAKNIQPPSEEKSTAPGGVKEGSDMIQLEPQPRQETVVPVPAPGVTTPSDPAPQVVAPAPQPEVLTPASEATAPIQELQVAPAPEVVAPMPQPEPTAPEPIKEEEKKEENKDQEKEKDAVLTVPEVQQ